jgi:DNA-binding NtrC family response regulator
MSSEQDAGAHSTDATATHTAEVEIPQPLDDDDSGPRFALVIYSGTTTDVVRLRRNFQLIVGRDFPAHVLIDDVRISRQHARFWLQEGAVMVEDLDSRNGTRVNDARIKTATLAPGDEVLLGSARIALAMTRASAPSVFPASGAAIVLEDPNVVALYAVAKRAAVTELPVLVLGETGTGKEHLAKTIHAKSQRSGGPFRAINCGAIPPQLVESALFGHERGAFTGADRRSAGLFEDAAGGTVFLDEIAELPASAQAALLRVLEAKTFQRVGSTQELKADVRLVAATHCDLNAAVAEGTFRKDLLYRINTVTLELPPLRERRGEIEPLVERFLGECREEWGVRVDGIEPDALEHLRAYAWPGNIRQLRNAIELAALVAPLRRLRSEDLPAYLRQKRPSVAPAASAPTEARVPQVGLPSAAPIPLEQGLKSGLREYEARLILEALRRTGGRRRAAAKLLRIPTRTLYRRMQGLGLNPSSLDANDLEFDHESD